MALTAWQSLWKLKFPGEFQFWGLPEENPFTDPDSKKEVEAHKWWLRYGTSEPNSNFREGGSIVSIPGAGYVLPGERWFEAITDGSGNAPSWLRGRYDRGPSIASSASMGGGPSDYETEEEKRWLGRGPGDVTPVSSVGGGPSDLAESKAAAVPRKGFLGRKLNTKAFWEAMAEQEPYVDQTTAPSGGQVGRTTPYETQPYNVAGGLSGLEEWKKQLLRGIV